MAPSLSGQEIKELAEYMGMSIDENSIDEETLESEVYIFKCPEGGIFDEDTGKQIHTRYVAQCDGCDAGECTPLGPEIEA